MLDVLQGSEYASVVERSLSHTLKVFWILLEKSMFYVPALWLGYCETTNKSDWELHLNEIFLATASHVSMTQRSKFLYGSSPYFTELF